jgi:hypothetical protein
MIELIIIAGSAFLLFALTLWKRKSPANLREIPALTFLYRTLGLSRHPPAYFTRSWRTT